MEKVENNEDFIGKVTKLTKYFAEKYYNPVDALIDYVIIPDNIIVLKDGTRIEPTNDYVFSINKLTKSIDTKTINFINKSMHDGILQNELNDILHSKLYAEYISNHCKNYSEFLQKLNDTYKLIDSMYKGVIN